MSILEMFLRNAAERGEREALVFLGDGEAPTDVVSFRELSRRAERAAARLREHAQPGERVLLLLEPGPGYVASFLGCLWAGLVAVPAYPLRRRSHAPRVDLILKSARPRVALTDDPATATRLEASLPVMLPDVEPETTGGTVNPGLAPWRPRPEELAFLQYTSGSTGEPRGVMITHANLLHNERAIRSAFRPHPDELSVTWLPPYHDMGLIGSLLQPLAVGMTTVVLTPTAFLQRPMRWVEAIARYRATYSGGPDFAYSLLARSAPAEEVASLDLSCWEVAYEGAERVRPETLSAFARAFAPAGFRRSAFAPCFGLAESTLMVTAVLRGQVARELALDVTALEEGVASTADEADARPRRLVACGTARDGEVRIVDPASGAPCAVDRVGEIWVSGPSVARGYFGQEAESEQTFRAKLAGSEGDWLRTGDLGCLVDGELVITGRLKDVIIVDGKNHAPEDVEATAAASSDHFVPHGSAAFSLERQGRERVVVVQEVQRTALRDFDAGSAEVALRTAVSEEHGLAVFDVVFVRPHGLPRTSSGKLRRSACRDAYTGGQLPRVERAEPKPSNGLGAPSTLETLIRERLGQRLELPSDAVDPTLPFAALGLDSLSAVVLSGELAQRLGRPLSPTLFYDYPNVERLAAYLASLSDQHHLASEVATHVSSRCAPSSTAGSAAPDLAVAIVGIGCRLPGASSPLEFLELLRTGRNAVLPRRPSGRPDASIAGPGGFLDDPSLFDAEHFGIFPREAERMDPQQRLVLEVSWEALEHAAIAPDSLGGRAVGVFLGISGFDYSRGRAPHPSSGTGLALSIAANRVSYALDLRGPSLSIDTACSSSLVAVHAALQSLRSGESELALAGGVNLLLDAAPSAILEAAGMLSPDGRCAAFDKSANGYVRAEGACMLVLKPLARAQADGDPIIAVLCGSAVNQDGRSNGLTAPNGLAQRAVIGAAWQKAGIEASDIGYVEAHGTGTPLGDPIELNALASMLEARAPKQCWVGSVKTNLGHLEAAAGVAGLIKAALTVSTGEIFPTLHYHERNPELVLGPALAIADRLVRWDEARRVAGVSSFGFGGTNAHVLVESPPADEAPALVRRQAFVAMLSARRSAQLPELARRLARWVEQRPDSALEGICASLAAGRAHAGHRRALLVESRRELVAWLEREGASEPTEALRSPTEGARCERQLLDPKTLLPDGSRALVELDAIERRRFLTRVAEAFVAGARIDWAELVSGVRRAGGLPPLPFLRVRHWVPAATQAPEPARERTGHHPLLGRRVILADQPGALFQSAVSLTTNPELHEHRAFQHVVVAGACQVSLLLDAHRQVFGERPGTLRNLAFPQGLILQQGETRIVQLQIDEARDGSSSLRWQSYAERPDGAVDSAVVHAVGSFEAVAEPGDEPGEFESVVGRCPEHLSHDEFYALAEGHGLQFGDSYRWNDEIWAGRNEAVARLRWPVSAEASSEYGVPPGLIDSTFQLAAATGFERGDEAFILFRIREYSYYRSVEHGEPLWAHAVRHSLSAAANVHKFSTRLYDASGRLVAEARDVELHRASIQGFLRSLRRDFLDGLFYGVDWQAFEPSPGELPTRWLTFTGDTAVDGALIAALENRGAELSRLRSDDEVRVLIPATGRFGVLFTRPFAAADSVGSTDEILASQEQGSVGLLAIMRAVVESGRQRDLVLRVVASDAAPEAPGSSRSAPPLHAPLRGLMKSFGAEHPHADVRFVDAERDGDPGAVVRAVLAGGSEPELAVRPLGTLVPRVVRTAEAVVTDTMHLDAGASYLVTGGTGGLGLRAAHFLVSRGARHLALLARREPEGEALAGVSALRSLGAEVCVLLGDVSDEQSLTRALSAISRPLRGVVHAAGVLADGTIEQQTNERFLVPFMAKLVGTLHLERLTREQPLDFVLLFSSVASLLGSPAQSSYAAANAFLDAFAAYSERKTISVLWGPWAEVGMAARQNERARGAMAAAGFEALRPTVAAELIEQLLRSPRHQVAAMAVDWKKFFATRPGELPLLERLREGAAEAPAKTPLRVELIARVRASDPIAGTELLTTFLCSSVAEAAEVAVEAIDPHRRLNELGLDSLMALSLQTALEDGLGVSVHITRFMQDVSIHGLAEELYATLANANQPVLAPVRSAPAPEPPRTSETAPARQPTPVAPSGVGPSSPRELAFSLFYFSRKSESSSDAYRLLTEGARFADEAGLLAVWLPERHFHEFGGLYPNPSVLAAHLASLTRRVRLRAGSVVLPLHHPLRVAEEWSVVDNLSGGRVDVSFVRGWGPNDFVLAPSEFARRGESLLEKLDQVRRLWRGEALELTNANGEPTKIRSFPRPIQPELPTWLTCTRDDERFVEAGRLGVNVLTALLLQSPEDLERRIVLYRDALAAGGRDPSHGHVTLMLHTFVGDEEARVLARVRQPLEEYLRSSLELWSTGAKSLDALGERERAQVLEYALERYCKTSSLIGTPEHCLAAARRFRDMGVNEIACLVDFGVADDEVLAALSHLPALQARSARPLLATRAAG